MKGLKFIALSTMALTILASCKEKEPKKNEIGYLQLKIASPALRYMDSPVQNGTKSYPTVDCKLIINDGNGGFLTLSADQINSAKTGNGVQLPISTVVTKVSMKANGEILNNTEIKDLQKWKNNNEYLTNGKFAQNVPLTAESNSITSSKDSNGKTIYKVTLSPKPLVSRLEVSGHIKVTEQQNKNTKGKCAYNKVEVQHIYLNNYLKTINGNRYLTPSNGKNDFDNTSNPLIAEMHNEITSTELASFTNKQKCAAYIIYPKKSGDFTRPTGTTNNAEYWDHVIVKVKVEYSEDAKKVGAPASQVGFITLKSFKKNDTEKVDGFEAGKIYKIDLGQLGKLFKTKDDGRPDDPVKPDPESKGSVLEVKIEEYTWDVIELQPDVVA